MKCELYDDVATMIINHENDHSNDGNIIKRCNFLQNIMRVSTYMGL